MARQKFAGQEFNSTNATIEETAYLGEQVPGFHSLGPMGTKFTRAYVKEAGSTMPVAVTEPDGEFEQPTLKLRQSQARVFLDKLRERAGVDSDEDCVYLQLSFVVTYRPQDEERTPGLPSEVYSFDAFLCHTGSRSIDRGNNEAHMVEFPLMPVTPMEN